MVFAKPFRAYFDAFYASAALVAEQDLLFAILIQQALAAALARITIVAPQAEVVVALAAHTAAIIIIAHSAVFADLACSRAVDTPAAVVADLFHAVEAQTAFFAVFAFVYAAGGGTATCADILLASVEAFPAAAAVILCVAVITVTVHTTVLAAPLAFPVTIDIATAELAVKAVFPFVISMNMGRQQADYHDKAEQNTQDSFLHLISSLYRVWIPCSVIRRTGRLF